MVLPAPAAAAEEAGWLRRLRQSLVFGDGPRLVVLRAAGPEHLRPVVEQVARLGPLAVCLRFAEVRDAAPGCFVVLALHPDDFVAANIARPLFRGRNLRVVLLLSDEDYARARRGAPDLMDWASATVEAEPVVPGFVADSVRLFSAHFPGFSWTGTADAAAQTLQALQPEAVVKAVPSPRQYADLVAALAARTADEAWCLVPVATEADALRLRLAAAETGRVAPRARGPRQGGVVAVGHGVPGWPTLVPLVASWADLRSAAPPLTGTAAVALDAEAGALDAEAGALDAEAGAVRPRGAPAADWRLDAISGAGPAYRVRAVLEGGQLGVLRRRRDQIARSALRHDAAFALHHVAAAADRARKAPDLSGVSPRLASAALVAQLRLAGPDASAIGIAQALWWSDLASHWWRRLPGAPAAEVLAGPRSETSLARASQEDARAALLSVAAFGDLRAGETETARLRFDASLDLRARLQARAAAGKTAGAAAGKTAGEAAEQAARGAAERVGVDHPLYLALLLNLADVLHLEGFTDASHDRLDDVLDTISGTSPRTLPDYLLRHRLAQSLFAVGRQGEAAQVLHGALGALKAGALKAAGADVSGDGADALALSAEVLHRLVSALGEVEVGQGNIVVGKIHRQMAWALRRARHERIGNRAAYAPLAQAALLWIEDPRLALACLARAQAALNVGDAGGEDTRAVLEVLEGLLRTYLEHTLGDASSEYDASGRIDPAEPRSR